MKILVTNDDGIHAPGLLVLVQELRRLGEVYAVAPDRPRSATGHSITLHKPLRAAQVALGDGSLAWASNGTPSDCVVLGISDLLGCTPDMVISGINPGANLGEDLTYSGTVSAAMEATILNVPSFAISVAGEDVVDFRAAAEFAVRLAKGIADHGLPPYTFLNVNVPDLPQDSIKGMAITRQARRKYKGRLEKRIDPRGQVYYWLGGELLNEGTLAGTDVEAIEQHCISITPVHLDLTQHEFLEEMKSWEI
jgi:5'-nucleotidase